MEETAQQLIQQTEYEGERIYGTEAPIAWHVPNLINICIDSVEDGEMTGKIYHCYSEEAIAFSNIIRMIETVEEFF